jgi:hypothetical protein
MESMGCFLAKERHNTGFNNNSAINAEMPATMAPTLLVWDGFGKAIPMREKGHAHTSNQHPVGAATCHTAHVLLCFISIATTICTGTQIRTYASPIRPALNCAHTPSEPLGESTQ